ncbi:hypothetical protein K9B32_17715 [Rhizobium sp. 3T7]|uniref:hypothetical protein n=1 Tax=Rhizobium sp. 3T7 TaxID=2874922 RepID=UPI001CCE5DBA|nr:hypothetical protein [Rhizobium sp. 3T7]MBZ9791939.1 hypothetical protein [Rhizobium sp. 3T7]
MMFSFTNTQLSERDGLLSLSVSLVNHVSRRSYTLRCELRRDEPGQTIDAARFDERLQSLRRSIDNSFSGN